MPRVATKRSEHWGTGKTRTRRGDEVTRTLARVSRGDEWRRDRNRRRRERQALNGR